MGAANPSVNVNLNTLKFYCIFPTQLYQCPGGIRCEADACSGVRRPLPAAAAGLTCPATARQRRRTRLALPRSGRVVHLRSKISSAAQQQDSLMEFALQFRRDTWSGRQDLNLRPQPAERVRGTLLRRLA